MSSTIASGATPVPVQVTVAASFVPTCLTLGPVKGTDSGQWLLVALWSCTSMLLKDLGEFCDQKALLSAFALAGSNRK